MSSLPYIQIILSILLVVTILLQNRGSGLSAAFGGDFGGFYTKRGLEKFLFGTSVVLATLFIITSVINVIVVQQQ